MSTRVEEIAAQVRALDANERAEFLEWLSEFELEQGDEWDCEIEADSQPGGRLARLIERARRDVTEGKTRPLDETKFEARNSVTLYPSGVAGPGSGKSADFTDRKD